MAMNLGSGSGNHDVMVEMNTTPLMPIMRQTPRSASPATNRT